MNEITEKVNALPVGQNGELIEGFDPKTYAFSKYEVLIFGIGMTMTPTKQNKELLNWMRAKTDFHIDELREKYGTK